MKPVQLRHRAAGIRPQAGGSLDPNDVVGRDDLVSEMFDCLARKIPLLVTDPRRMGKTSLLDRLVFLTREPWTSVKIDFEGVTTVDAFLCRTVETLRAHQPLRHRVVDAVKTFVPDIDISTGPVKIAATFKARPSVDLLETMLSRVDDRLDGGELLVLALDEVPLAIENIAAHEGALAADALLQTLRRLRLQRESRIRWIVTGSVGFHHVLRLAHSTEGAINDLESVPCGPLGREWAVELARQLLVGIEADFDDGAVEALVDVSGSIPYLMHYLAASLRGSENPCTPTAVQEAWEAFVHDRDRSRAVTHFLTRIGRYYGDRVALAYRLLDIVAVAEGPISSSALVAGLFPNGPTAEEHDLGRELLDDLVDDHYLRQTATGLEWRYPVLREIWAVRRRLRDR